jgi:putative ABC transport system permease protein
MIVRQGMRLTAVGVAIGLVLAAAATRLIAGFLFGVSSLDAITFIGMATVFAAVALVATWLPARRAAGANPMTALRGE